ncbi:MAG: alpha/beta hydrolase fold domain-containing protein [Pseudomonadales bacterium]|nr:alpha/beta hydrolase fold domain-containing protein [Pseudomonadales bacterium]
MRLVWILGLMVFALHAGAEPDEKRRYHIEDGTELEMNIFIPGASVRSGIVLFFGGGWRVGSPRQFFPFCDVLKTRGIACFVPDYRVSSRQGTDGVDALNDARAAVSWVAAHSEEFGIDEDKIYVGGGSAGGHLAAALTMIPREGFEFEPAGMVLFNPAVNLTSGGPRLQAIFRNAADQYSPSEYVRASLSSTWIVHGTADKIVPHQSVVDFCDRMEAVGNACELHSFENQGHGFFNAGRPAHGDVLAALLNHLSGSER